MSLSNLHSRAAMGAAAALVLLVILGAPGHGAESHPTTPDIAPNNNRAPSGTLVLPAEVVAYQSVLLTAKVAGFLKSIPVDKGDRVKAGELIADIEVPELLADRLQFRAQVDVARREYERMQEAAQTAPDLVTPDTLDNAHGRLEVAQAQLDRVNALLTYARITAPFSGTITARYVDAGAFIPVPSQSSQQSAAIVTLMDFSHVRIQMWVPESDASRVRPGCKAVFSAVGLPDKRFTAAITRVSYALERDVRTMLAEIDMENPDGVLQPGMYLSVQVTPAADAPVPAGGGPTSGPKGARSAPAATVQG
jgi:membrane fusion protein (multidrug efflux system)